jgi:hypothetical protein
MDFENLWLDWNWSKSRFGNRELTWERFGVQIGLESKLQNND